MYKNELVIINRIKEIENATFDEDCIKLLLIEIREKLKSETLLKEVCHFIAHHNRDSGICHKKVDVRYAKFKFFEDNTELKLTKEFVEQNKYQPERFFTDTMLNYIETPKIDKKLFELIILEGIDDIEPYLFKKYYKLSKREVKNIVSKSYHLKDSNYIINKDINIKDYQLLDDLLKFIRGTITGKPVFNQTEISGDFLKGLSRLCTELKYELNLKKIKDQINDIVVTILAILHDSKFTLFDGEQGKGFLSLHPKDDYYVITLMAFAGRFTFPLIMTEINASKYIDLTIEEMHKFSFESLHWNTAVRDSNGKIELGKTT